MNHNRAQARGSGWVKKEAVGRIRVKGTVMCIVQCSLESIHERTPSSSKKKLSSWLLCRNCWCSVWMTLFRRGTLGVLPSNAHVSGWSKLAGVLHPASQGLREDPHKIGCWFGVAAVESWKGRFPRSNTKVLNSHWSGLNQVELNGVGRLRLRICWLNWEPPGRYEWARLQSSRVDKHSCKRNLAFHAFVIVGLVDIALECKHNQQNKVASKNHVGCSRGQEQWLARTFQRPSGVD